MTEAQWLLAVRRRINDPNGTKWSDDDIVTDAILSEARSLVVTRLPREFLRPFATRTSRTIADDGSITQPEDCLRIIGGVVESIEFTDVVDAIASRKPYDPADVPTEGSPRLEVRNKKLFIHPLKAFQSHPMSLDYIAMPTSVEDIPDILFDAVVFGAAARLVFDVFEHERSKALIEMQAKELERILR